MRAGLRLTYLKKPKIRYSLGLVLLIGAALGSSVRFPAAVQAAELQNRSVQLASAIPSALDIYSFNFFVPSINILGSIEFDFCSNSPILGDPCIAPAGLDVSSANLINQSGNTGFSVDGARTTSSSLVISRPPLAAAVLNTNFVFDNMTNPSAFGTTTFVRITTYASSDTSGGYTDNGSVAYVTVSRFSVDAFVPPFLQLCVGITVSPNCSFISGDRVDLGILSNTHASAGTSQFAAGTNSPSGYAVYGLGTTLTSGNKIIPALSITSTSLPGSGQFGINLRANLSPPIGSDPVGIGIATPTPNYNQPNEFTFNNGDMLADSPLPSDYNRMTVSYLANVPASQQPGVYSTTITYQAIAQF